MKRTDDRVAKVEMCVNTQDIYLNIYSHEALGDILNIMYVLAEFVNKYNKLILLTYVVYKIIYKFKRFVK